MAPNSLFQELSLGIIMQQELTYKKAGVDITAGNALVEKIKGIAVRTKRPEVLSSLGGFSSLFEIPVEKYKQPLLVSTTDGVGTKLKLAIDAKFHQSIGIDLVAMCVNDIIVTGAEPLYFLDYFATGHLDVDTAHTIISGIGEGCLQAGCSLVGGETAEMPGMYQGEDYDLAGFCVGIVDKSKLLTGQNVKTGDVLIGIASSGAHSNGYSLIRKILETKQVNPFETKLQNKPLIETLLTPTKIYVKSILALCKEGLLKSAAHITGGGIVENVPRVIPANCAAQIDLKSWQIPEIFNWLQKMGNVPQEDMWRTFNCGVGMVVCVDREHAKDALRILEERGEIAWVIGKIVEKSSSTMDSVVFT